MTTNRPRDLEPTPGPSPAPAGMARGAGSLIFASQVVKPNRSTGDTAVLAETLNVNADTVRSAASQTDASLLHS